MKKIIFIPGLRNAALFPFMVEYGEIEILIFI